MTKKEIQLQPSHVKAYRFIEKYTKKNIVSPEVSEIAKGIGMSERQTYRAIDDLQELGFVSKVPYTPRSIKIVKPLT